ncbi:MAG: helix-turn-helix transcriptional regulator [Acutalibacteraceae bacterium]
MNSEQKNAKKMCKHISGLCDASCALLTLGGKTELFCEDEDWLCKKYSACDYCNTLHYGCSEAFRWNGSYVFYCPKGFVFIAASTTDDQGTLSGGLILGPIVMGEPEDTLGLFDNKEFCASVSELPQWDTVKVRNAEEILKAVASTLSGTVQSRYGSYVFEQEKMLSELYEIKNGLKNDNTDSAFLIRSEKELNAMIANQDKDGAQNLLNEILGYIFFTGKADLFTIKARLIEMLVLLSRSAIDAGAGIQEILLFNEGNIKQIEEISSIEDMSAWITVIMHRFIQYSFDFSSVKHSDIMYKIMQYVKANYDKKITLEDIAEHVYLSRSYVSSMFKEEMGESLFSYINRVRVEKSKILLLNESVSLANVGGLCGFEDQSYFTKVFKNIVGMSPKKFRDCRGKNKNS